MIVEEVNRRGTLFNVVFCVLNVEHVKGGNFEGRMCY